MGKLEYLELLKRAMLGLPPEVQAKTLGYYEQRFVDGLNAGRSEQDVAGELDDPKKIAMTLRANSYSAQLGRQPDTQPGARPGALAGNGKQPAGRQFSMPEKRNPAGVLRMLVSGAGLAIFNLFMVVPAMVFSALLMTLYVAALAFYLGGIAITASGLAGSSDLLLELPGRYVQVAADDPDANAQIRVRIDETGINVHAEDEGAGRDDRDARRSASRLRRGAEVVAGRQLRITTDMDADSRTTQTVFGFGLVLGGIAMFLLSLVVTRHAAHGIKRYFQMNFSLLKGQ